MNTVQNINGKVLSLEELSAYVGVSMTHDIMAERLKGSLCACEGSGIFVLKSRNCKANIEGGKFYMKCIKCGEISHL